MKSVESPLIVIDDYNPNQPTFKVKLLSRFSAPPYRASPGAAGYDLFATHNEFIPAKGFVTISTEVAVEIPNGYFGQVCSRSSLARKGITVHGGIIDSDYRGPINVILYNFSTESINLYCGDRIAQLILIKITTPNVEIATELTSTIRDIGGFGSTGK